MRYLFLLFYESSQLFLFCHVRVFLPCNFSRIHRKIPFLIHRYIHVTGPILFSSSTLSFSLPPLTSRRRRRNSKTNSTAEKEEKEEEKEEEKNEKERGRGRKRERGREIHPSARRLIRTRIVYPRRVDITSTRCSAFFSLSPRSTFSPLLPLVFSLLCTRGRILMARKRQECETPKGCREKIARPFRGCNLSWVGGQR